MKKLFLNNTVIKDVQLDNYDIAVYVALRGLYDSQMDLQVVTYNMIAHILYGNKSYTKYTINHIKSAFSNLELAGLIKTVNIFSSNEFVIDMSGLYFEQNPKKGVFYTVITLDEVHKIMNIDTKRDNFAILRYFIVLISSICHDKGTYDHSGCDKYTDFVGFMTLDTLAEWCGTTKARIIDYNTILESEEIVYIYRHTQNKKDKKTGQIMSFSNHYGRYEDKELITQFANEYIATFNLKEGEALVKAEKSKENKRYAAIYNLLVKDFDKYVGNYSETMLIETYKYIHSRNICHEKELQSLDEGCSAYDYIIDKIKNEDVFDDIPCVVDYVNKEFEKKQQTEKRNCNFINDWTDEWGEPDPLEHNFSIEEILDMPTLSEVRMNLTNSVCEGQNDLRKEDDNEMSEGENSTDKNLCVAESDLDFIDIESLFEDEEEVYT